MPTLPRPRAHPRDPEPTRQRILDAAETLFAERGFEATRLREVAAAAKVHHALVLHYFESKQGLLRAVLARAIGAISMRAFEVLGTARSLEELIDRQVELTVDHFARNRNLLRIVHGASRWPGSPAYAVCMDVARRLVWPLLEATSAALERFQREGLARADVDPRRLVVVALGAIAHVFHEEHFLGAFLGADVRSDEALAEHRRVCCLLLRAAVRAPQATCETDATGSGTGGVAR
ncbi:MAG: TetR family transcriptional regulator [Myxococcota bacterium]|nr:TetR family transcriptional regulator [Myxococcota bacterium]MDW8363094.1 TetR family transcriptional regulator [Myxococcales bacterium]